MLKWLAQQIYTHPRTNPGLVVARLIQWSFTLIWGMHVLIEENALRHPVYAKLNIQTDENAIGTIAVILSITQLWRIITHQRLYAFGFAANITALLWYVYLISAMFVFVPLAGPVFSASMTLMCVISIISFWNDPCLNSLCFSRNT